MPRAAQRGGVRRRRAMGHARSRGRGTGWRQGRGDGLADRPPVDLVATCQVADRNLFLSALAPDTLEQLHSRQLLLPRSGGLRRPVERRDELGRGWGQFRSSGGPTSWASSPTRRPSCASPEPSCSRSTTSGRWPSGAISSGQPAVGILIDAADTIAEHPDGSPISHHSTGHDPPVPNRWNCSQLRMTRHTMLANSPRMGRVAVWRHRPTRGSLRSRRSLTRSRSSRGPLRDRTIDLHSRRLRVAYPAPPDSDAGLALP